MVANRMWLWHDTVHGLFQTSAQKQLLTSCRSRRSSSFPVVVPFTTHATSSHVVSCALQFLLEGLFLKVLLGYRSIKSLVPLRLPSLKHWVCLRGTAHAGSSHPERGPFGGHWVVTQRLPLCCRTLAASWLRFPTFSTSASLTATRLVPLQTSRPRAWSVATERTRVWSTDRMCFFVGLHQDPQTPPD